MKQSRIRSFVRREGRVTIRQRRALEQFWDRYVIELNQVSNITKIFPGSKPITLEIGFGMGASLAELASQQPHMNFLGVEVHRPGVGSLLADIEERGLTNIRIMCADIIDVLAKIMPSSLQRILIFFPDPWHKKRHHKRRLIQVEFIECLKERLEPNGILHFATDWSNYAEHMLVVMDQVAGFERLADNSDPRPQTKFEQRGLRLGHEVVDLIFKKI